MSPALRLDVDDVQPLYDRLDAIERSTVDLRPAWSEMRRWWQRRTQAGWRSTRWAQLSDRYARQVGRTTATLDTSEGRAPRGLGHTPGQLRRLVAEPQVFEPERQRLVMGVRWGSGRTPAFYGQFHQEGRGVPRRPFWRRLTPTERGELVQIVADPILESLR